MATATVIAPGAGELIGDAPDRRVEILSDDPALDATWSRFGPGRDGADLHIHRRHTDLFYVLEGELTLRLGLDGAETTVPAGMLARIPPLVVHGFRNASGAEVRYLNLHAPGPRFAEYLRARRDGREFTYDQEPPPADGAVRPPGDAVIGAAEVLVDRPGLRVTRLAREPEIAVHEIEGTAAPAPEAGRDAVESVYVLDGELELTADGEPRRLTAGTWAQVPAGVDRELTVSGTRPARVLVVRTPGA